MTISCMANKSKKTKNQLRTKEKKIFIKGTKKHGFMAKKSKKTEKQLKNAKEPKNNIESKGKNRKQGNN